MIEIVNMTVGRVKFASEEFLKIGQYLVKLQSNDSHHESEN